MAHQGQPTTKRPKKANKRSREQSPVFERGVNRDVDITPPERHAYGWTLTATTPDYRPTISERRNGDDGLARWVKSQAGQGFRIELALASADASGRFAIQVGARAESPNVGYDMPLEFDQACLAGPDLERFAVGLLEAVRVAKREHPHLWSTAGVTQ